MRRDDGTPGMRPDGAPFPVHALVLQDAGRGALWGLVAGDALGRPAGAEPRPGVAEQACAVAESLMARGRYDAVDVAGRAGALSGGGEALARAVPVALFYANDDDLRHAVTMAACAEPGDPVTVLASAAVSGAIAALVFRRGATAMDAVTAAISSLDAVTLRFLDAAPDARAALKAANDALRADVGLALEPDLALAEPSPGRALRVALWHLVNATPILDAIRAPALGSAEGAVVGALLGARVGEQALPAELRAAAGALGRPPAPTTIERLLPFVQSGPFARG